MDYFEARKKRFIGIDKLFTELAVKLNNQGIKTITSSEHFSSSKLNTFVTCETENNRYTIGFGESCYHFYISVNKKIHHKYSEGYDIETIGNIIQIEHGVEFPWTIEELIEIMK